MSTQESYAPESPALVRPARGRMVAGVAAGIADYLGVDPTVIRIAFVALTLIGGAGVPLYIAGWLLMPEAGRESIAAGWRRHADGHCADHQHEETR